MRAVQIILVLFLAIAVTACGQSNATSGGASGGSQPADNAHPPKPDPAAAYGERTIKHAMGTVTLKKKPERVVILFNGAVDNAVALGVKPVGAVESWEEKP